MNNEHRRVVPAISFVLAAGGFLVPFWPLSVLGIALAAFTGRWILAIAIVAFTSPDPGGTVCAIRSP